MRAEHLLTAGTRKRLLNGIAAAHFDDFAAWLQDRRYSAGTIRDTLQSLAAWTDWLAATELEKHDLEEGLAACAVVVRARPHRKYQFGPNFRTLHAVRHYLRFLRMTGKLSGEPKRSSIDTHPLLREFETWLHDHRGVTTTTVTAYRPVALELLNTLGDVPGAYTAEAIRDFALQRARRHGPATAKRTCIAVRSYLRFLGATGRLRSGLDVALPPVAVWSNSNVPRHLSPTDLERLLASIPHSKSGQRDRAALLLLGRLGLRAGDVVKLRLADIDFRAGTLAVNGKTRRRELLPLPQDVGDALVDYLRNTRDRVAVPEVFLTARPPPRPLSPQALAAVVAKALDRAGISAPTRGCHLLRHSAATSMLRRGASLAGVSAVLRHRQHATTIRYAKVDDLRLLTVAQPWPGAASC